LLSGGFGDLFFLALSSDSLFDLEIPFLRPDPRFESGLLDEAQRRSVERCSRTARLGVGSGLAAMLCRRVDPLQDAEKSRRLALSKTGC
jgi:hypothetical protein